MFETFAAVALGLMGLALILSLVLILKSSNSFDRAVLSDLCFYSMLGCYIIWSMVNTTQIAYDVVLLGGVVAGVLPTMSVARIISKGRR